MADNRKAPSAVQLWARNIALVTVSLWVGSLWGVGFLAVPVLFRTLPDKMLAGMLAGKMFTLVAYVGMVSACYLMIYLALESGKLAFRNTAFRIAVIMLLLVLVGEFFLQPEMGNLKAQALPADVTHSAFADRFQMLHYIATGIYIAQALLGIVLVLKTRRWR